MHCTSILHARQPLWLSGTSADSGVLSTVCTKKYGSGIVTNGVSLLQTTLRYREGHEARRMGLEAMPLNQQVKGRHGERKPCVEIRPYAMHGLFEMRDERQHRQYGLDEHAVLPLPTLTQFEVLGGQTPPRHPFYQWELKPTGSGRGKSPLGLPHFLPYNLLMYYIV